jgi:hypothetical protein
MNGTEDLRKNLATAYMCVYIYIVQMYGRENKQGLVCEALNVKLRANGKRIK